MTKKKMKIIKFLLLPLVFILFGCEKDLYDEHLNQKKIQANISLEQFKKETGLKNFNTLIKIKTNITSASLRDANGNYELSDFEIDLSVIKRIAQNEDITYTFQIVPIERVDDRFYNLIYFYDNGWQPLIVEIVPTEENLFELKAGLTDKIKGTIRRVSVSGADCITLSYITEDCHGCTGTCDRCYLCIRVHTVTLCGNSPTDVWLDAPPSPPQNGSGGTNGTGGNGTGGNSSGVGTTPVLNGFYMEGEVNTSPKTPCQELLKLSTNNPMVNALTDLKDNHTNDDDEKGYNITKNNTNGNYNTPTTAYPAPHSPHEITMPTGGNNIGTMHSHIRDTAGYIPMFSDGDLYYLFRVSYDHNNNGHPKDYSEYFLTLTVPEGTFAIKIKDIQKFYNFMNNDKWDKKNHELKALRRKYDRRNAEADIKEFQKDLLSLLKEMDAGVGLYEASTDFSSWDELSLDPNNINAIPIKTPCN